MCLFKNNNELFKDSITSNTLLQVNATIIAGILVFTSLVSLRILALEFDVTPTIQMIKETYLNIKLSNLMLIRIRIYFLRIFQVKMF